MPHKATAETSGFFQDPYMWSEDEGRWTARLTIGAMFTGTDFAEMEAPASESDFAGIIDGSPPINIAPEIAGSSLNVTADLEYRMTEHIALSASLGYLPQSNDNVLSRVRLYTPNAEQAAAGLEPFTIIDGNVDNPPGLRYFPVSASVLFYPAPYGAFRPYIGGGYHYTKVTSEYELLEIADTHGFLVRAGTDWWFNQQWGLNFDIRYHQMEFDADFIKFYPRDEGGDIDVDVSRGTLELNPITVNVGFNYRF